LRIAEALRALTSRQGSNVSQLEWSPQRLDALNRLTTVARLLSTAIHETGNSLQIIAGNAEMLEARPGDEAKTRTRAQNIRSHADRAGARLRALIALATAPAGPPRRLNLAELTDRALDLRRYTLRRAQVVVETTVEGTVEISADETVVIRLLANLLLSAEAAIAGQPGARIQLHISRVDAKAVLLVEHNGPAIPADQLDSLFEPFADADAPDGGLAAARWLATSQGGTLEIDTNRAEGIAVRLELPAEV
jgi:C4-dicarboxylate-specific signal transduction histidine kinase